jgi:methionyl-tRNA synthetase
MNKQKTIYITTTLPYVNAKPHVGHAKEFIQADVFARIYRQLGYEVFLNTGTDEHGAKILEKAQEEGLEAQEYCDQQVQHFIDFCQELGIEYTRFIRTTDADHVAAAQEFWRRCRDNGYIYKKKYQAKYCVGCELEKTDSELVNGECPDHPGKPLELIDEENYFFKFSAFEQKLLDFYQTNPGFARPARRLNEIKSLAQQGFRDFSISRLKEKVQWGIEVPDDPEQVMYVWFDALVNYISTLGWFKESDSKKEREGEGQFAKFWTGAQERIQFCGKDNLRQQTAMWQAMLMSVFEKEIEAARSEEEKYQFNSTRVYVNGFIQVSGQKMSKTLGNVIDPLEMKERYGADATRYLLLATGSFGEDADLTWEKLDEKYNADLANGIGNLVSRVVTLYRKLEENFKLEDEHKNVLWGSKSHEIILRSLKDGRLEDNLKIIMDQARNLDKYLETEKPWELAKKDPEKFREAMEYLVQGVYNIGGNLGSVMPGVADVPGVAEKIRESIEKKEKVNLFPRV